jgi:hypothetical protein
LDSDGLQFLTSLGEPNMKISRVVYVLEESFFDLLHVNKSMGGLRQLGVCSSLCFLRMIIPCGNLIHLSFDSLLLAVWLKLRWLWLWIILFLAIRRFIKKLLIQYTLWQNRIPGVLLINNKTVSYILTLFHLNFLSVF